MLTSAKYNLKPQEAVYKKRPLVVLKSKSAYLRQCGGNRYAA